MYRTPVDAAGVLSRRLPSVTFYPRFVWNVYRSSGLARRGVYDDEQWVRTSGQVITDLERAGVKVEICGIDHVRQLAGPCVFVGNHMSMLETIVLPAIIQPVHDVTFVVKQSLMNYPMFRHIVRTRNPIAVSRDNPREDLKRVLSAGVDRLKSGISVVVFPQTTRTSTFDPTQFNTIGVKLALRGGVPVIPIALQTDAWGNGIWLKDIGRIDPKRPVRFEFGRPIEVTGRGTDQHQQVIDFIHERLHRWAGGS